MGMSSMDNGLRMDLGEQGFLDRSLVIRWLLGIIFFACLLLFMHFREIQTDILELNTPADRYVITQIDYQFPDEESYQALQQAALRDIGKVYRLSPTEVVQARVRLQELVDRCERSETSQIPCEKLDTVGESLADRLLAARFVDGRTLKKMETLHLDIRELNAFGVEQEIAGAMRLPPFFWNRVQKEMFEGSPSELAALETWLRAFEEQSWVLEVDPTATERARQEVAGTVPQILTKMTSGERLIDKGERVSSRHITSLQAMNQELRARRRLFEWETWIGSIILSLLLTGVSVAYLRLYQRQVYFSNRRLSLTILILLLTLIIAKGTEYVLVESTTHLADLIRFPLLVPFAAILLCNLLNGRVALYFSAFLAVVMTVALVVHQSEFLFVNLVAALIAIFTTYSLRRRKEIFTVCGWAFLAAIAVVVGFYCYDNTLLTWNLLIDICASFVFMLVTGVLVVGLLPLLESMFRVVTDVALMEYMDPTYPLLRKLATDAPGTYQHSIIVSNLAETAAIAIGVNGLLCRAAAIYHDIGKVVSPQYFTENQSLEGMDVHRILTPLESAQAIMAHVPEGIAIAKRHGLPDAIVDVIREHHGTTLVYYFYHKACREAEGSVNQEDFRYPGPKPRRRETAIIMIADTAEAAARSLEEVTEEALTELVDRLVREKAEDGQFDECEITFEELAIVKRTIIRSLIVAGHSRIRYPHRRPILPAGSADDPALSGAP